MLSQVKDVAKFFNITEKLGEGTFSKVYRARLKENFVDLKQQSAIAGQEYALKYIIPIVKPARVMQEIRFLRDLGGFSNIIELRGCFFENGHTVVMMPILEHDKFTDYFQKMDINELREFMRNLFIALERVHMHDIIHRDIKPSNFLYNRKSKQYSLVDFGLSQSSKDLNRSNLRATFATLKSSFEVGRLVVCSESKARKLLNFNDVLPKTSIDSAKPQVETTESIVGGRKRSADESAKPTMMQETKDDGAPPSKLICIEQENLPDKTPPSNVEVNKRVQFIQQQEPLSTCFTSMTPTKRPSPNSSISICDTPAKDMLRTPLAEDRNRTNLELQALVTPNKEPSTGVTGVTATGATNSFQLLTPIKVNSLTTIQPTPPKTVARQFEFKSATKELPMTKLFHGQDDGDSINKVQAHFRTPVVRSNAVVSRAKNNRHAPTLNYSAPPPLPALSRLRVPTPSFSKTKALNALVAKGLSDKAKEDLIRSGGVPLPSATNNDNTKKDTASSVCQCAKTSNICAICLRKPELNVPRAGTAGFRAPEILLRSATQTTKIDVWSAGVIMACILSGRYPFFRSLDDMTCLAEVITILGSSRVKQAAKAVGKLLVTSQSVPAMDLKDLCVQLRSSLQAATTDGSVVELHGSDAAYDLLGHLLDPNPYDRYSASEALRHPFFSETRESS